MKLPPLNGLKVFAATARKLSMAAAAQELCLTHGAVSRQIKSLEASLGVLLFVRRNRAIFLTRAGEALYQTCTHIFAQLAQTIEEIQQAPALKPLVVSCEPTIAMRWLIARLPDFQAKHPSIVLHLFAAGGAVQFMEQGVDLAIRRNDFAHDYWSAPLADEMVGPVCTPEIAPNLAQAVRLHSATRPNAWANWCAQTGQLAVAVGGQLHFEHFYLSLQAASAGLGVAMASRYMVEQELADGRLVAPFGFSADGSQYGLLSAMDVAGDERKARFLAWLREQFAQ
ncbi:MAG: LysR substrate-binding domain-containing protein [Formosimonas sp.]